MRRSVRLVATGIAAGLTGVLLAAGCSSSSSSSSGAQTFCARSPVSCRCESSSFTLSAGEQTVSDCNSLPTDSYCCHDLDTTGATTKCECGFFACAVSGNGCRCGYRSPIESGDQVLASCDLSNSKPCCFASGSDCTCNSAVGCTTAQMVTSCPTTP